MKLITKEIEKSLPPLYSQEHEGPHYPEPHRFYAQVEVKDGRVIKVLG